MTLLLRLLMRDLYEFARNPALLALVLAVPLLLLMLIGQLNVRPPVTRVAIVDDSVYWPAANEARERLRNRLREIADIEWVEWCCASIDLRERAAREAVDVVLVYSLGQWRAYSAVSRNARAAPAHEVARLLMRSLQRDDQLRRQLAQQEILIRQLRTTQTHAAAAVDGAKALLQAAADPRLPRAPADDQVRLMETVRAFAEAAKEEAGAALTNAEEHEQNTRADAALPTSLEGVWLAAQLTPLWAPASPADHALVPAYIALIAVFVPFVLASAALVRERETGTLGILLVATRRRWVLLAAGKLLLPILAGMMAVALLLVAANLAFGFGIKPGLFVALLTQVAAAAISAIFGLVVSSLVDSAREAYAVSAVYLVALILLTGMVYPLEQSASAVVAVAHLFPLTLAAPAMESWMNAGVAGIVPARTWLIFAAQATAATMICALALRRMKRAL